MMYTWLCFPKLEYILKHNFCFLRITTPPNGLEDIIEQTKVLSVGQTQSLLG